MVGTISERAKKFTEKYGRGDRKLIPIHIKNRKEKLLGTIESNKIKGLGKNKSQGINFNKEILSPAEDAEGEFDNIQNEVIDNLEKYPLDVRSQNGTHRIINLIVKDDGSAQINGIIKNGKENNPNLRTTYSVSIPSDEEMMRAEKNQYQKGELKEVSDRTLALHDSEDLTNFETDLNVNTEEDTEIQY